MQLSETDVLQRSFEEFAIGVLSDAVGERLDPSALDGDLEELGVDSLTLVQMLFDLEEHLGREIEESEVQVLFKGGSLRQMIQRCIATQCESPSVA